MKLRVSPGFDPLKAQVGPDEYFVLSRIDGKQTIREILLSTGLPIERGIAIVTKLRSIGALLLPGESSVPPPASAPAGKPRTGSLTPIAPMTPATGIPTVPDLGRAATVQVAPPQGSGPTVTRSPTPRVPMPAQVSVPRTTAKLDAPTNRTWPAGTGRPPAVDAAALDEPTVPRASAADIHLILPNPTAAERVALAEQNELSPGERLRLLQMARLVDARDPWALLGVNAGAAAKDVKRAYFKLSKEVHPDRYYGRQLGSFAERLVAIFEAVNRAYAKLTAPDKARATGAHHAVQAEQPQTPQEYAAELFDRACALEVGGDPLGAMKLFAAAVRIDPQTRYLRRAATCALAAEQPKTALEYAKKAQTQAPTDPSSARLLASAFRATGKLADAEEVLIMAMALKSENDVLAAELRNDLAEVRRLMSG